MSTTSKADINELVPRRYQEEILVRAKKDNIIAAMDTGSGKTLISLLLIKWITSQEHSSGKVVIFLVPQVPLVEQQGKVLSKHTNLKVMKLHGALDLDLSDRGGWQKRFENNDVLIMTAQIFLNILTHSLWSIDKVSLMVFDECHHTRKNHPYNCILREYFQVHSSIRPKVFGMTASPIWNTKNPLGSLAELEANMDAKVIAIREHVNELAKHSPKPSEVIKEYPFPSEEYDYPSPTIRQALAIIDKSIWDQLNIPWSNIEVRYCSTLNNLGPYCASLFLYMEIQHHVERVLSDNKFYLMAITSDDIDMDINIDLMPSKPVKNIPKDVFDIFEILRDFEAFFPGRFLSSKVPVTVDAGWYTPKVHMLIDILKEYYTPTFQCIVFVEQRQDALCLARLLQSIPTLMGQIRCGYLMGHGASNESVSKTVGHHHGDPIKSFRERQINILIATAVAEEGLDFPACDLVVRFDFLHHMVGYVQSRGRARNKASTFVVMIQKDDVAQMAKYKALQQSEPVVNSVYQTLHMDPVEENGEDDDSDETHPTDLAERERYVVPSSKAILTYDNCLGLLNHLCALIPRDAFTPVHTPKYEGDFEVTLYLPRALPLASSDLVYTGPRKRSKREARRAVAFKAVMRLREIDVFDEHLLPVSKDADGGRGASNSKISIIRHNIPCTLTVPVKEPWCMGWKLWIHPLVVDGSTVAGLVTGTSLAPVEVMLGPSKIWTLPAQLLSFEDSDHEQRVAMNEFTRYGILRNITARPFPPSLSFYLVPVTPGNRPDFESIKRFLANPRGNSDWSGISEDHYGHLVFYNRHRMGRMYSLQRIRSDLSPMSTPAPHSREAVFSTYRDYWNEKWSRKTYPVDVACHGPLLEGWVRPRSFMALYHTNPSPDASFPIHSARNGALLPQTTCLWLDMPFCVFRAFEVLPVVCHRITHLYRARCAQFELSLPPIPHDLLVEALTLPLANFPFNNQRLETLGDAVLQLCTTVHLLNHYPNRHEGQLTNLRQKVVNNRYLLNRALDIGLEHLLISEPPSVFKWKYTLPDDTPKYFDKDFVPQRSATRMYPRRSLQDSMEALLGASFLAGGISLALLTGTSLGLEFGGPLPWFMRYANNVGETPIAALFASLEGNLGYKFRHNHILLEALSHPSFVASSEFPSYQRLEFLGDAVLDLMVVKYLYDQFPNATSHQLSLPRSKVICAASLAHIAVNRLELHKMILANNIELNLAIDRSVSVLTGVSGKEIIEAGWKFDPPKALSDVFESVIGAVLVDSGYDYEKTVSVLEHIMSDVLDPLSPSVAWDPVTDLISWMAGEGCRLVSFEKKLKKVALWESDGIAVMVHGVLVAGPIISSSLTVARFVAAERALAILKDSESDKCLNQVCDCAQAMEVDGMVATDSPIIGDEVLPADPPSDSPEDVEEVNFILSQFEDTSLGAASPPELSLLSDPGNLIEH